MKKLIFFLILIVLVSCARKLYRIHNNRIWYDTFRSYPVFVDSISICDSGYQWVPSFSWSYSHFIADTCMSDSAAKNWYQHILKSTCGLGWFSGGDDHSEYVSSKWNDSLKKCVPVSEYKIKVKGEWVEITKEKYDSLYPPIWILK